MVVWRGFKAVGETGIGNYIIDNTAPAGPSCVALEDNSDKIWNPDDL
jgi:hypothetical protein